MADIFLSYLRLDKDRVRPLVAALREAGLSLWWDDDIAPDAPWETTIEHELAAAGVVVVCWSTGAVASENVRAEARRAKGGDRLIQVFIERCEPPLFFGERQGIELSRDPALGRGPEARRLIDRVSAMLESNGGPAVPAPAMSVVRRSRFGRRGVLVAGGAALIAATGSAGWLVSRRGQASVGTASVAVMPFANLSGDPAQAYFSDGLAEELRNALSRVSGIKVTARTSSEKLRDADAVDAARKLGVANILIGSVRRSPTLIRVNAQLVDGATGVERWSQSYDRPTGDSLSIQTGVAQNVARALSVALGLQGREAIGAGGTTNVAAHDLYLRANEQFSAIGREADVRQVLALVEAALTLDPRYAFAHILRARTLAWLAGTYAHDAAEARANYALAAAGARTAIALVPDLAAGHAALGAILADQLHVGEAVVQYRLAATFGEDVGFLRSYGILLARLGRGDEAIALLNRAVELDPINDDTLSDQAWVLFMAHHYERAIEVARRTLVSAPQSNQPHYLLGASLLKLGRRDEARAEIAQLPDDNPTRLTVEAVMAGQTGDLAASDRAVARLAQIGHDSVNFQFAEIYAQRGDHARAIAALDRAWASRDPGLLGIQVAPFLDPLRADARFKALVAKLDLPSWG